MGSKSTADPAKERLSRYGLEIGQQLRYRPRPGGSWRQAVALGVETDGSVQLLDDTGRARPVLAIRVEKRTVGPRGGKRWEPLR